jgi:hypothetical protein
MTVMIMVVVVFMIRGAQINAHHVPRATKFCTVVPNIYEFAMLTLFNPLNAELNPICHSLAW